MEKQQNKIPEVRFPEFKDDWVNEQLGKHIKKTDKKNKENLNLPVYSINNKEGFLPQSEQFDGVNSNDRGFDISIYKIIQPNTFAYNPARINVGSIGYSHNLENILISSLYVCFRTDDKIADSFLLAFLDTNHFKTSVLRFQEGGVRQYLFFDNLSKIKLPFPTLPEQQKIAHFFSILDKKLTQLQEKKTALELYKKGMMQQIFSQQLRFKDDTSTSHSTGNIKDFPEWEVKKLGDITKINQGLQIKITDRFTSKVENSFFYITNEFLRKGNKKEFYIKNPTKSVLCDEDDILMTRTGNTGMVVTGVKGAFHNNFFKINFNRTIISKDFLYFFLTSEETQHTIIKLAGNSTIPDLNHGDFYGIRIQLPSLKEQTKIANFLSKIDDKINTVTEKIEQTKEYKKGLLQKMFV